MAGTAEQAIRDAMARGEFDHLPGAGKPIPNVDRDYDPDWWARRYVGEIKARDAADELRRTMRRELPRLRTTPDRTAAAARVEELNRLAADVNRALAESERVEPIAL